MRKRILATTVAIVSLSAMGTAQASEHTGWYTNLGVGGANYHLKGTGLSSDDHTTGAVFNVGWRKAFIGVEAGYTDLGSVKYSNAIYPDYRETFSAYGYTAGFDAHINVTEHFYLGGRAGAFFWKLKDHYVNTGTDQQFRLSSTGWYAGLAGGYDIDSHWSIGGNFNFYRLNKRGLTIDTKLYTVTAEYRF